jgi:hypothetical protein
MVKVRPAHISSNPMPITAKLSRKFYDKLGDDVANELVEWFNQVDAIYRADLRELNELNFARFDAKLEQRLAELKAELRSEIAGFRAELANLKGDLVKWMFVLWAGTALTVIGLLKF